MARRRSRRIKKLSKKEIILAFIFAVVIIAGYFVYDRFFKKEVAPKGEISFHFMTLGNKNSGDCIYIRAGENDILIDAGSDDSSINSIKGYLSSQGFDGSFEYVIATHADEDHIACFAKDQGSIFDLYECEVIIDFPRSEKTTATYNRYKAERDAEVDKGAKHYTALECYKQSKEGAKRSFNLTEDGNVKMEILYNYYYENDSSKENNYSVCLMFYHGSKKFLFTGDLESRGEKELVEYYSINHPGTLSQVELYKAGHHGSSTSTTEGLMEKVQPKICVVQCAIEDKHGFPHQEFINRIAPYTSKIYVNTTVADGYTGGADYADANGNVVVISDEKKGVYVECSNNNVVLKNMPWFTGNRDWPANGVA